MSITKDRTATGAPTRSSGSGWFLGCFGCSGKKRQHKDKVNFGNRRRNWIPNWSLSFKKSTAKTVPFNLTTVPRKSKFKNGAPATSDKTWEIQVMEEDATLTKKPRIYSVNTPNGSYRTRRKETKAAGAGFDLPEKKAVTILSQAIVTSSLKPLIHPTSIPPAAKKKHLHAPPSGERVDGGGVHKTTPSGGVFDSIIGMSVILVILVIMVLWGKICAIFCTSAWFFVAPRLVAVGGDSATGTAEKQPPESHVNLDLQSVEYKKKVVLEGLLQRNNRNINIVVGRL